LELLEEGSGHSGDDPLAVIDVDLQNAFPSLEWAYIRDAVAEELSALLPWTSEDQLGPLLCALALARVVARTRAHGNLQFADVWYMDDGQIVTRSSSVDPWLRAFDAEAAVAGAARGRGEHAKSVVAVVAPPGVAAAARPRWATEYFLASVAPSADGPGRHVLGVDFGSGTVGAQLLAAADRRQPCTTRWACWRIRPPSSC